MHKAKAIITFINKISSLILELLVLQKPNSEKVKMKEKGIKKLNYLLGVSFLSLIMMLPLITSTTTENECVLGGGKWIVPKIASPDEPSKSDLKPYCECDMGFFLNESSKKCEDDTEIRCVQTQGKWINENCQCPESTIKCTTGFGWDMSGPVTKADIDKRFSLETKSNTPYIYPLLIFILLMVGLILYFNKRRNKRWNLTLKF